MVRARTSPLSLGVASGCAIGSGAAGDGFQWQLSKRLEKGRFVWPSAKDGKIGLTPAQLAMLLAG